MSLVMIYSVYDRDSGDLLVTGTARECAAKFGITEKAFKDEADNTSQNRLWDVNTQPMSSERVAAIRSWDAFCEPLRKKYGIKVWHGK